jgi:L-alanine-DL-glutamate epimerase-like enolase superfamily enzyme
VKIQSIEVIPLAMRYHAELAPHMLRSAMRAKIALYRLTLANGTVGYGETVGAVDDVSPFIGQDALAGLRTIRHAGVQMACYDAVGKALGVPAHVLMGRQARPRIPFAYWTIDLPPDLWAEQVSRAAAMGYTVYKFKLRPWWDPIEQIEAVEKVAPPGFTVWLDFNGHLREARFALPVLQALSRYTCVGGFESPIPQRDVAGYQRLRAHITKPIAVHYGSGCCHVRTDPNFDKGVPAMTQIQAGVCDGFVFGGTDVETLRNQAAVAEEARLPFWLQPVGSSLRAAWVMHVASTCRQATLSSLAAHEIWQENFADVPKPLNGWVEVPNGLGLGVQVDEEVVARLQQAAPMEDQARITTVIYANGQKWHFGDETLRHETFYFGELPGFTPGVRLETWEDDGSTEFEKLFAACRTRPLLDSGEADGSR